MFPMVVWVLYIYFRLTDNELIVPDCSGITVDEPSKLRLDMMEIHGLSFFFVKKRKIGSQSLALGSFFVF